VLPVYGVGGRSDMVPIWHCLVMPRSSQDDKIRLGEAAEHLVLSRLMRHGHVAAQAPRRYSTFDLFTDK
jgi:hypothetical protein